MKDTGEQTRRLARQHNQGAMAAPPDAVPVNTSPPVITGTPAETEILQCNPGVWTDAQSFEYAWRADGVFIPGADTSQYIVALGTAPGTSITCDVTAINGTASAVASSNALVVA